MFTFNGRITLLFWMGGRRGELQAAGAWGEQTPLQPSHLGLLPSPLQMRPSPPPHFAKSADPDYSEHGGPCRLQSPDGSTHGPPCGAHVCNSEVMPGPHQPSLLEWGSLPQSPLLTLAPLETAPSLTRPKGRLPCSMIWTICKWHLGQLWLWKNPKTAIGTPQSLIHFAATTPLPDPITTCRTQ